MAKISFNITIKNWAKHNSNKKKNHRYFFLENRFFQDDKISQLSAIETRLYLYLLTVASDLNQDSYILHTNLIPSYFRLRTNSIQDSLIKFESLQLVKYEKNASNTIENKTKEDKIKEKKLPAPQKIEEKEFNKKIWETYSNAYRLRYGIEPIRNASVNSQISNLRKKLGLDDSIMVVEFYLLHNDAWFVKNTHSFGLCLSNAETLRTQALKGKAITFSDARNFEKTQQLVNTISSVNKGENF